MKVIVWCLQQRMFTPGSHISVSYRREFCVMRGVVIVTNRSISLFSVAGQLFLTCETALIYSNVKGNDL